MKKNYAPIILFTYRRLNTLKKTILNLSKNDISKETEIFIFSDGYKNKKDKNYVLKVRKYLENINSFKKKKIFYRKKNLGLSKNIISGVTRVLKQRKMGIILEDDIIVAPNFLRYMNTCLNKFKKEKKIWHINGWNYNIKNKRDDNEIFYWRGMHCWGWATWHDRWVHYENDVKKIYSSFNKNQKYRFNYDGTYDFWRQIERNYIKKINTWAIFWYVKIFMKKGLCVSPKKSLSYNIGNDRYATNMSNNYNNYKIDFYPKNKFDLQFQKKVIENKKQFSHIKKFLKKEKILNKLKNFISYKF